MAAQPADDLHRNLMINAIPPTWDDAALQAFSAPFGPVESVKVVIDKATQRSKGFGFVKFLYRKDAENCLAQAQGMQVEGKMLRIQKAELGKGPPGNATVYVSGFDENITGDDQLLALFSPYGNVLKVQRHPSQPGKKGVAFITFEYFGEAQLAVESLQGVDFGGSALTVRLGEQTRKAAHAHGVGMGVLPFAGSPAPVAANPLFGMPLGMGMAGHGLAMGFGMPTQPFVQRGAPVMPSQRFQPYSRPAPKAVPQIPTMVDPTNPIPPNGPDGLYTIFVYGVQGMDENFLQTLFSPYGTIFTANAPAGKNFGFVHMPLYIDAANAVNNLNGAQLPGMSQPLQVSFKK